LIWGGSCTLFDLLASWPCDVVVASVPCYDWLVGLDYWWPVGQVPVWPVGLVHVSHGHHVQSSQCAAEIGVPTV